MRRGWWLWAIIVGVWLLTIPFLLQRAALERSNRTVEIVVDLVSLRELSAQTGISPEEMLSRWSEYGVTAVAVTEPDEIDLIQRVGLRLVPRSIAVLQAVQDWDIPGEMLGPFISMGDVVDGYPDALPDTARALTDLGIPFGVIEFSNQLGDRELAALVGSGNVFVHSIPRNEIAHMSDGQAVARFNRAMLERQARVLYVHPLLGVTLRGTGASFTTESARAEFGGGSGISPPSSGIEPDTSVTFTGNATESDEGVTFTGNATESDEGVTLDRNGIGSDNRMTFSRNGIESDNLLTFSRNDAFIRAIGERAAALGLLVGPGKPLPPWSAPPVLSVLITVAAAAALLLVGRTVVRLSFGWELLLLCAAAGTSALLLVTGRDVLARQAAALAVACVFPILACLPWRTLATDGSSSLTTDAGPTWTPKAVKGTAQTPKAVGGPTSTPKAISDPRSSTEAIGGTISTPKAVSGMSSMTAIGATIGDGVDARGGHRGSRLSVILSMAFEFCRVVAITLVGAGFVATALADTMFFLKLEQFRGVKLAHLVPLAVLAAAWARDAFQNNGMAIRSSGPWRTIWQRLRERIGWRHVVIGLAVLGAAFVLVARTGHYVLPVSAWERAAREALEQWLVVRPRTKEFVLGYPALVVGLLFLARKRRDVAWPWLIAGTIASVSVINTFAHAHVSLAVSTVRTFYGMLLGLIVSLAGIAAWSMWRRLAAATSPRVSTGMRVR